MSYGLIGTEILFGPVAGATVLTHPQYLTQTLKDALSKSTGTLTGTQPVNENQAGLSGNLNHMYGTLDLYNRVHVEPARMYLGNLLSSQVRDVTVWNARFTPITLDGVMGTGIGGIDLLYPSLPPTIFTAMQELTYQIKIGTAGPPAINGRYDFNFSNGQVLSVQVTGKRVVIWPFAPQHGATESLEWSTNIIKSKSAEQRQALRSAPRQGFQYTYFMDDLQYAMAKSMAYGWSHRTFAVPVWYEATPMGTVMSGATSLMFDTTSADYRSGDIVLIWESYAKFEACEVATINSDTISFGLPVQDTYYSAHIMPLRYSRNIAGLTAKRDANKLMVANAEFEVVSNIDLGASVGMPQYLGYDVLEDVMAAIGEAGEKVMRDVTVIDNGVAIPVLDPVRSYTGEDFTISWSLKTRSELWRVRKWLHSRKGKQKAFWLPTNLTTYTVLGDLTSTSTGLMVTNAWYTLYRTVSYIKLKTKSGVIHYNKITGSSINPDGSESLFLQNAIGFNVAASNIEYVCQLHKVRLDSDRIEISHEVGMANISIQVTGVPE